MSSEFGVAAYDTVSLSVVRTYTNSSGLTFVGALATDASGNLFVGNQEPDEVLEFAAGTNTLIRTLPQPLPPVALAVDHQGNFYVASWAAATRSYHIAVYTAKGKLSRTITDGLSEPSQMAFDSQDNLYVANFGGAVTVYKYGQTKLARTIGSAKSAGSLIVDSADDVYVGICLYHCSPASVVEYGPQGKGVLRTIRAGIRFPDSLALDASGNLFVSNGSLKKPRTCYVSAYEPNATEPFETITDGVSAAGGVVFDNAGNLYVANGGQWCNGPKYGSVTVYGPGSTTYSAELTQDIRRLYSITIGPV